jgi:hypothetical protein
MSQLVGVGVAQAEEATVNNANRRSSRSCEVIL